MSGADLVAALARPLPIAVICELLGAPAGDQGPFRVWSDAMVFQPTPEAAAAAAMSMTEYLTGLLQAKDRSPGGDLLSALVRARDTDGDRLGPEDVEIGGVTIPAGESVLILLGSASRDPGRFPDPDRFDIGRPRTGTGGAGHLAFGHGIHHCLGAPLARLEAAVAFTALLDRFPDLALAVAPEEVPWRPGLIRGLSELPVRYTPRRRSPRPPVGFRRVVSVCPHSVTFVHPSGLCVA
ncbi:cytochrome P450 [Streptomyces olivoreticuli]